MWQLLVWITHIKCGIEKKIHRCAEGSQVWYWICNNKWVFITCDITCNLYFWVSGTQVDCNDSVIKSSCTTQIARFTWPTWGPPGADRSQVGPMLAPWTLLSGNFMHVDSLLGTYQKMKYHYSCAFIFIYHTDGWVEGYSYSSAFAIELLQSCTKPTIYSIYQKP